MANIALDKMDIIYFSTHKKNNKKKNKNKKTTTSFGYALEATSRGASNVCPPHMLCDEMAKTSTTEYLPHG